MCLLLLFKVTVDRLFRIEKKEFLDEPISVHRCQLIEGAAERNNFEKYLNLIKSDSFSAAKNTSQHDNSLNSSHIAMENIEIKIRILSKAQTNLQPMTYLKNTQYTIDVLDFKRIRTSFPVSPFQNIGNQSIRTSQKLLAPRKIIDQESMVSLSLTNSTFNLTVEETRKHILMFNDSTERMLCAQNQPRMALKKDFANLSPNDVFSVASSNIKHLNSEGNL